MLKLKASLDTDLLKNAVAKLDGDFKVSLARRMGVTGGRVLRDEAIRRVPVGRKENGSRNPGLLKSAMYVAYNKEMSILAHKQIYVVSWNRTVAPHGHLIEFGHLMPYRVVKSGTNGYYMTRKDLPYPTPRIVPAYPFLRPAWDSHKYLAVTAMMQRAKEEIPALLRGEGGSNV